MENLISGQVQNIGKQDAVIARAFAAIPALQQFTIDTRAKLGRKMQCRLLMKGAVLQLSHTGKQNIYFIAMGEATLADMQEHGSLDQQSLRVGDECVDRPGNSSATTLMATTNCLVCYVAVDDYTAIVQHNDNPMAATIHGLADAIDEVSEWVHGAFAPDYRLHT